jgi:hypothetical protein
MARSALVYLAAAAAIFAGCKKPEPPRPSGRLGELTGAVIEVAVYGTAFIARLDARGCPEAVRSAAADVNGVAMQRADDADAGFGVEARGCSGRWTLATTDLPHGNLVVTISDESAKLVVETLPITQKAGFKLGARNALVNLHPGDKVSAEAHGPIASKLLRPEIAVTSRRGEKLKLGPSEMTVIGSGIEFALPSAWLGDGGKGSRFTGELTVSADADAAVRCEGAVHCAAPVRAATTFAVTMSP